MRNSNANNTILFSEKKKEFENSKDNHNFHDHKALKDKNAEIISLSSYKRLKFKKNHFKKEGHVDTNKNKLKNNKKLSTVNHLSTQKLSANLVDNFFIQ